MADTRVLSNQKVAWLAGPDNTISESNWASGPTITQLAALDNYSAAVKIDGTDFSVEASEQSDDRSFADAAGAQSRSYSSASGNIEVYTPAEGETTGVNADAYDTFSPNRSRLALLQRTVAPQSTALARGDEVNIFRVITDERQHNRNDVSRTLGVGLILQDNIWVNYIVPHSTPTAPAVTPGGPLTLDVSDGDIEFLEVAYEGRNITVGATYISSNEDVFIVTNHGIIIPIGAGSATLTVSYPGAAVLTGISVTVTA